jgi:hypothetical protein
MAADKWPLRDSELYTFASKSGRVQNFNPGDGGKIINFDRGLTCRLASSTRLQSGSDPDISVVNTFTNTCTAQMDPKRLQ